MIRIVSTTFLCWMVTAVALRAAPDRRETPDQVFTTALRESIGALAQADIGDEAVVRLSEGLILIPRESAAKLLTAWVRPVPPNFEAMLIGDGGVEAPGIIRFVPTGFTDSDAALTWTADDMLSSLNDTLERDNLERVKKNLEEREAQRWVLPPRHDPETHQLTWAALIVPKSAPRGSDGETTYHAIGFGRDGYVEITIVSSMQKANETGHMAEKFLSGLNFRQGKAYGDALPADPRVRNGLAEAMGIQSLHKALVRDSFWGSDKVAPVAEGFVASIGALSLLIYVRRHMRHEARRGYCDFGLKYWAFVDRRHQMVLPGSSELAAYLSRGPGFTDHCCNATDYAFMRSQAAKVVEIFLLFA